jgi:DNA-binding LytR/AlgR family response regulator
MEAKEIEILIIEDDALTAESTAMLLEEFGFTIKAIADSIESAISLLNKHSYDIALVDIDLNGKRSGIEIGNMISKLFKIPFIFVTGITDKAVIAEAVKANPAAYLVKPPNPETLFACIQTAIQNFNTQQVATSVTEAQTDFFFTKIGNSFKKIYWKDVIVLSATGNYTLLTIENNHEYYLRSSLSTTLKLQIPPSLQDNFIQISRSEAVQINYITEMIEDDIVTTVKRLSISKHYVKDIKNRLNILH